MAKGWISLHRDILEMDGYFGERFNRPMCFIDLLLLAEWRENGRVFYVRGNKVSIKRGQVAISVRELADRWGMSTNTAKHRLAELEALGRISISHSRVINRITIINYHKYQDDMAFSAKNCPTENNPQSSGVEHIARQTNQQTNQQTDQQNDQQNDQQTDQQTDQPINNINNINKLVVVNNAREEKFLRDFFCHQIAVEQFCMNNGITVDECKRLAKEITAEWALNDEPPEAWTKKHLTNTIRIKLEAERKRAKAQAQQPKSREQWMAELEASAQADYLLGKQLGKQNQI